MKLTALGLEIDLDLCRSLLATVVADAAARGIFVRIDMEDSACTDDTLRLYRELREAGRDNVGIVLQSCLRRTLADVGDLADLRPNVRLCKGIYVEPAAIAFQGREAIRANFVQALDALLEAGCYVGVATHDEWLLERALERRRGARAGRLRAPDAPRRARGAGDGARRRRATGCASTSRTATAGTSTRSAACRRTRRSRG